MKSIYTEFYDLGSGGYEKLRASRIYIEAPKKEAVELFKKIFGRDPYGRPCDCCGSDYYVSETEVTPLVSDCFISKGDIDRFNAGDNTIKEFIDRCKRCK